MSVRELVLLGTASQVPTRRRNHNGYVLRWDDEAILFDPGEGTQRQFTFAGVSPATVTRICITHLHGDHCLGLPGMVQRMSLDQVAHPVDLYFPSSGLPHIERLLSATIHHGTVELRLHPVEGQQRIDLGGLSLVSRPLEHRVDTLGWRLEEPDARRMLPERLAARGVHGPEIGRLQEEGRLETERGTVTVDEVSAPRPGQSFAFVMDTSRCDAAVELARGADLLVCESTFLEEDRRLADRYHHLTAADAARIGAEGGARRLVLTHFSGRYADPGRFAEEAGRFHGDVVVGEDLMRVEVPERLRPTP